MKLEEIAFQQSRWEQEMLLLRQQLQASATRDMKFGIHQSVETLHIEAELATVQQKAAKLTSKRTGKTKFVTHSRVLRVFNLWVLGYRNFAKNQSDNNVQVLGVFSSSNQITQYLRALINCSSRAS